jgi:hypothetical protein
LNDDAGLMRKGSVPAAIRAVQVRFVTQRYRPRTLYQPRFSA